MVVGDDIVVFIDNYFGFCVYLWVGRAGLFKMKKVVGLEKILERVYFLWYLLWCVGILGRFCSFDVYYSVYYIFSYFCEI